MVFQRKQLRKLELELCKYVCFQMKVCRSWREICYPINRASITQQRKQSGKKSVLQYHHIATGVLLSNFSGDVLGPEFVDSAATAACEGQITVRRLKTRRTFEFVLFGVKNKMKKSLIRHSYSTWTRGSD